MSALCDAVQLTIPSLRYVDNHGDRLIIGLHLAAETAVFYIECLSKESVLNQESGNDSLEERASALSRAFVTWIGPVLKAIEWFC